MHVPSNMHQSFEVAQVPRLVESVPNFPTRPGSDSGAGSDFDAVLGGCPGLERASGLLRATLGEGRQHPRCHGRDIEVRANVEPDEGA